jgi:uncharacterized protein (DUF3820 family)
MESDITMPFGKYKGKLVSEIPHGYLLYMYDRNKFSGELKKCIENIIPVLRSTTKKTK